MSKGGVERNRRNKKLNGMLISPRASESRWVIAGGGTGGHLFPGIAVARELESRFENTEILFAVGRQEMESEILALYGYGIATVDVEGLKGRGWKKAGAALVKLPKSLFQSVSIIKGFKPALVLGMGGYSAGPICLAAKLMGVATAIHEQNSCPGLTNRLVSRFVDRVFISFEESGAHLKGKSQLCTGNPVRHEFFADRRAIPERTERFTVLVVGGSQGARAVNSVFLDAMEYLNRRGREFSVIHQTGKVDFERVAAEYRKRGLDGEISPFIEDMAAAYKRSHLVVSRAGATTIFELAATGRPSLLIPYPHAANQHQEVNALSLVRAGGAEMIRQIDLTGEVLAGVLMKYMDDRTALEEMGTKAAMKGRPDAARVIVDQLSEMTGI